MKALWHLNANQSEVKTTDSPNASGHKVHIKSLYSLISLGTERLVAHGLIPSELHSIMRVPYMEGEFIFPVKYGYSLVGEMTNTRIHCHLMHPHQSQCIIDPDDAFEIPPGIPAKRAVLASNLETALNGIWDSAVKPGERVAVIGFGMIGSLIARIASNIPGTCVEVVEVNATRRGYAEQFGFTLIEDPTEAIAPYDVAFHTSGTQEGLQTAIDLVGMEGRVIEMSWYGNKPVTLNLGAEFHSMRKQIISSQVGRIPANMSARWDFYRRKKIVFDILRDPAFDQHITHEVSLEEAAELFNNWRTNPPEGLGYCIRYQDTPITEM